MRLLVRTWNVFHGNASPPQRRAFLPELLRLASADRPDVVCVQELPLWSLDELESWTGLQAVSDVTRRALLGVVLGRLITAVDHGLFRSALTGQANGILLSPEFELGEHASIALSRHGEPRRCQAIRAFRGEFSVVVGNTHLDPHEADEQLLRAAAFVTGFARADEPLVLAGDFNITAEKSQAVRTLAGADSLSGATPKGIDHVLARGLRGAPGEPWPLARRTVDGRILSDHAPVDRELT